MQDFKVKLSHILSEKAKELYPEHEISGDDILSMLEYPPDTSMGDVALPCFKLSRRVFIYFITCSILFVI